MTIHNRLDHYHQQITGPAAGMLRDAASQVQNNLSEKEALRDIQGKFEELKAAIRSGDFGRAGELVTELRRMAKAAGYGEDSPLMAMLNSLDPEGLANRTVPFNDAEVEAWDDFFASFDRLATSELDSRSDMQNSLQIQFQESDSMLRRSEKAISDILQSYNNAAKTAISNMKA